MQDPQNGANPIMQRILPILQANIQEHSVLKYQEQMNGVAQQMMQQVPPEQAQMPSTVEMVMAQAAQQIMNANQAMAQAQSPEQQLVALEQEKVKLQQQKLQSDTQLNAAELEIKSKKIELEENEQILDILKSGAEEEFKKQKSNLDREARKEIKVMDILAKLGIEEDKLTASQKKNFEDKLLGILRDEEMVELNTLSQLAINAEKEKDK